MESSNDEPTALAVDVGVVVQQMAQNRHDRYCRCGEHCAGYQADLRGAEEDFYAYELGRIILVAMIEKHDCATVHPKVKQ